MSIPLPFPNINDTASNDVQTWSSSKILNYLKPALETEATKTIEKTGAEVTFNNIDPDTCEITKAVIEILPSQQGSGAPSPDNPRTINTFDTVHLTQHNADNTESTSYDISLGETVCTITGDAVTGEFEKTHELVDLGSLTWTSSGTGSAARWYCADLVGLIKNPTNSTEIVDMIMEKYQPINYGASLVSYPDYISVLNDGRLITYKYDDDSPSGLCAYPLDAPAAITTTPIASDLYEGTNVLGCVPAGTVDIEITCTDTIGNILKKEGIL